MIVTLMPGDVLLVNLHETDGQFTISYDAGGNQKLTVHADIPDTDGREGVIYCEDFSQTPEEKMEVVEEKEAAPVHYVSNRASAKSKESGRPMIAACQHILQPQDILTQNWSEVTCKECKTHRPW